MNKASMEVLCGFPIVISGLCVPIVDPEVKEGRVGVLHNFFQVLILLLQSQYFDCFNFIFSIAFINFKQIPLFIEFQNCLFNISFNISLFPLFDKFQNVHYFIIPKFYYLPCCPEAWEPFKEQLVRSQVLSL